MVNIIGWFIREKSTAPDLRLFIELSFYSYEMVPGLAHCNPICVGIPQDNIQLLEDFCVLCCPMPLKSAPIF